MDIAVYTRSERYLDCRLLSELNAAALQCGCRLFFGRDYADTVSCASFPHLYDRLSELPKSVDFIISLGGDGTFLSCVAGLRGAPVPILGINSGRLGFLSSVDASSLKEALERMTAGDYAVEEHMMLEVDGRFDKEACFPHAFNEFTIKSGVGLMTVSLSIDGLEVADYSADGLIVSTPTGSTAYSMSVGGPIVSPRCDVFIVNPIAPHNLTMRPLIVEASSVMELTVTARGDGATATLDNRSFACGSGDSFTLRRSSRKASVIKFRDGSFYSTLRRKLMWGTNII